MTRLKVTTESGNVYWLRPLNLDGQAALLWESVEQIRNRDPSVNAIKADEGVIGFALKPPAKGRSMILTWTHRERGPQIRMSTPVIGVEVVWDGIR